MLSLSLSLSLSKSLKKKSEGKNFRSRDDDDSYARRRRRRRLSFKKKARCSLRLVYPPPPPPPPPPRERARAEEVQGEKRESATDGRAPRLSFLALLWCPREAFCLTRGRAKRRHLSGDVEGILNRFKREKISTRKREKERAGREFGKEKSALDKRAEDAFLRGLIRTFA